jgi:hypothetical protein
VKNALSKLMSREGRKYIYIVSLAVVALLGFYGVITEEAAPMWIALIAAIISPPLALSHLSPKEPVE